MKRPQRVLATDRQAVDATPLRLMRWASAAFVVVGVVGITYAVILWVATHPVFAIQSV
ncbi:MAG: hypothetical protein RL341_252, partial [Pseudomonadota bacterium]